MPATTNVKTIVCKSASDVASEILFGDKRLSKKLISHLLKNKDVKLNGKRISQNAKTKIGDIISYFCAEDFIATQTIKALPTLTIVYEDENMVIIDKPNSIESVGKKNSCEEILKGKYDSIFAAHRLDRNTMGLLIFAKNEKALSELKQATKENRIEKSYLAWVCGEFKKGGIYVAYLFKDAKKSLALISATQKSGYVRIETNIEPIKISSEKSLVKVKIHNGKTHQIRAHLAFLGHPIIGDGKYGSNETNKKFKEKTQLLFAYKLKFTFKKESILGYLNDKPIEIKNAKFN